MGPQNMLFEYISTEDAIAETGLRMVVVSNVPSPWGEAAKGLLHMKAIPWKATRLVYDSAAFDAWAGEQSGPIAVYNDEAPRSGWREILDLTERLAPDPSMVAVDAEQMYALCERIIGQSGLAWWRRRQLIEAGLRGEGGFPERVSHFLSAKYGGAADADGETEGQVIALLTELADRLMAQKAAGRSYYFGDTPSAADVYSAATMALFDPLPEAQCAMNPVTRQAFETRDVATADALNPILLAHRDHMYAQHLELPLAL